MFSLNSIGISFLIILISISFNCDQQKPIDEEKFIEIYTDLIIYKDTSSTTNTSNDKILKSVLEKHQVTMEEYKFTIDYFNQDPARWEKFFDKAVNYLTEKQKSAAK